MKSLEARASGERGVGRGGAPEQNANDLHALGLLPANLGCRASDRLAGWRGSGMGRVPVPGGLGAGGDG